MTGTRRPDRGSLMSEKLASKFDVQHSSELTEQAEERTEKNSAEDKAIAMQRSSAASTNLALNALPELLAQRLQWMEN